ncbi:unnamed protein product [Calicophoron daubneyi]|uniref:Uncharacterized protein n=1 Tax=Calicophoron daubneyi TaxID=300641 RepID=A0AAV2TAD4_CALDB
MKDNNLEHYQCAMFSFMCHIIFLLAESILSAWKAHISRWFVITRLLLAVQCISGIFIFVYYNRVGNKSYNGLDPFHRRMKNGGFYEFMYCAMGEWMVVTVIVLNTALQILDLWNFHIITPQVSCDANHFGIEMFGFPTRASTYEKLHRRYELE